MSKATAVIDIGSNSARLVIYQESSEYGFHIICEKTSKVRIGEGAYAKKGYLQPIGIHRAYLALNEFIKTIQLYPVTQTLCVATSALRDAPNGKEFTTWIEEELNLEIKIIEGQTEARYGALAALNLLPIKDGITIDIGGGSSDLALIQNSKIIDTYSINLGTVRIKELFFDTNSSIADAKAYIEDELKKLPSHFQHPQAIGIGGTIRSLSKGIMKSEEYPLNKIHAFSYKIKNYQEYFDNISIANKTLLPYLHISKSRFDTIREGALIFQAIIKNIGATELITSGVGVREGVFLNNFLEKSNFLFPKDINPSIQSMLDRFETPHTNSYKREASAKKLFNLFSKKEKLLIPYLQSLLYAIELTPIGYTFNIYEAHQHAYYTTKHEFNFAVTHQEMILTAMLLRFGGEKLYDKEVYRKYKELLPKKEELKILSFIYSVTITLYENSFIEDFDFELKDNLLTIKTDKSLYLAKETLQDLERPSKIELKIQDIQEIPRYNF
ncbi:MAG: Ppx/GppA family phosphatase [Sulfurovaceae bacterium]|nr:Ppx/GppA family phosphatase [Sulfurovaceae bacterium]